MKVQDMTQRYRKFKRSWGMWYAFDTGTGNSVNRTGHLSDLMDQYASVWPSCCG